MREIYRVGEERALEIDDQRHRCHGDNRKPEYMLSMGDRFSILTVNVLHAVYDNWF